MQSLKKSAAASESGQRPDCSAFEGYDERCLTDYDRMREGVVMVLKDDRVM